MARALQNAVLEQESRPPLPISSGRTLLTAWEYAQLPSKSFPDLTTESPECQFAGVSKFPTSVHVELLAAGKIKDPYKGLNEADVQCTCDWWRWLRLLGRLLGAGGHRPNVLSPGLTSAHCDPVAFR
jgi:hypothetical protein